MKRSPHSRRGIAIVIVLCLLAVISMVTIALARTHLVNRQLLDRREQTMQADWLARGGVVTPEGVALRQHVEDETDRLTTLPWELLGLEGSLRFAEVLEPPCELLLRRVDVTAGSNYQPASRRRSGDPE